VKTLLVPIIGCFFLCSSYGATTNLVAVADTTLFEVSPNNNLGRSTLAVGSVAATGQGQRGRGLLRFDVSGIPTNAVIDSAALTFTVVQALSFGPVPSSFRVHRFLKPWVEGVGTGNNGAPALAGETTWNAQFHGTTPWSPAGSAAGVDYTSAESGSVDVDGTVAYTVRDSGLAADVQAWVSGAAANHGWIMISSGEGTQRTARRVGSRESGGAAPSLAIQYTIQPTDPLPRIAALTETNDQFQLRFTVPSTYCYEVQVRDSLTTGSWSALTNICAPTGDISAVAADSLTRPQRFYRLFISGRAP
jgi:hypothetical protein